MVSSYTIYIVTFCSNSSLSLWPSACPLLIPGSYFSPIVLYSASLSHVFYYPLFFAFPLDIVFPFMIFLFFWQTQTERGWGIQIEWNRKKINWNIFTHQSVFESILSWVIKAVQTFHKVDHNCYVEDFMKTTRNQDSALMPARKAESSFPMIKWTAETILDMSARLGNTDWKISASLWLMISSWVIGPNRNKAMLSLRMTQDVRNSSWEKRSTIDYQKTAHVTKSLYKP